MFINLVFQRLSHLSLFYIKKEFKGKHLNQSLKIPFNIPDYDRETREQEQLPLGSQFNKPGTVFLYYCETNCKSLESH